jgi:hypothetical protein
MTGSVSLKDAMEDPSKLDGLSAEEHAAIMKELAAVDGGESVPKVEPKADPVEEPEKTDDKSGAAKTDDGKKEDPPTGVLAPNGKSIIPYGVLQGERNARQNAERALNDMSGTVVDLQERIKALESGKSTDAPKASEFDTLNAEIDKLAEEAPEHAAVMRKIVEASQQQVTLLQEKLDKVDTNLAKSEEEIQAEIHREVATALDSNPALTHWKANNPELFAEAIAFDDVLKTQPKWDGKTFAERFEQVVKLVVADHAGEDILPEVAKPKQDTKVDPVPAKTPDPVAVAKAAEAKLAKAEAAPGVTTLSDLPAGSPVEQSEQEKVENMSSAELWAKMSSMTPDKLTSFLQQVTT